MQFPLKSKEKIIWVFFFYFEEFFFKFQAQYDLEFDPKCKKKMSLKSRSLYKVLNKIS